MNLAPWEQAVPSQEPTPFFILLVASMGIFVGGISALVPHRAKDISVLGLRALWTAYLTTLLTGCIADVLSAS